MEKPITLRIKEFKQELVDLINKSNLHPYIKEGVVKDLHEQLVVVLEKQAQAEEEEYENSLKEEN